VKGTIVKYKCEKKREMLRIWSDFLAPYRDDWWGFLNTGINIWIP